MDVWKIKKNTGGMKMKPEEGVLLVDKIQRHKTLCSELNAIYTKKNNDYGDAFSKTYKDLGIVSAITRISDKYNRLCNLALSDKPMLVENETIVDTLLDMANYCLMTIIELTGDDE